MAKDPVCGINVSEKETTPHLKYQESTYYFCTTRCKQTFQEDPQRILDRLRVRAQDQRKVVIVGAGEVGATFAFSLMMSGLASSIALIDLNTARAEGHAMDLNHGLSFVQPAQIFAGNYADCKDAAIVMIAAGAAQKPGETRLDLVRRNTEIYKDIIPRIVEFNPRILLIVTNPVDILTYVALKISEYPPNRVFGSGTLLDTARFRYLLSSHCNVDPRNVHAY
ncbi:MAG TPA: YHS domain-containing protein, partial [Thermodesulfobacteriota bacterium]|nr:YHS domain-containing protein [Thermodesulfobacteriota bacterium]